VSLGRIAAGLFVATSFLAGGAASARPARVQSSIRGATQADLATLLTPAP
jgi:hypothetical protein